MNQFRWRFVYLIIKVGISFSEPLDDKIIMFLEKRYYYFIRVLARIPPH